MTAPDPGHLWPDEDWARVVRDAELEAARIAAGVDPAWDATLPPGRYSAGLVGPLTTGLLSGQVTAARHGGRRPRGAPTFGVLHSAETPLVAGYAASIARMFATTTQDKSCHYMVDPAETWGVLDDALIAWHVGNGNPNSIGVEQAGYARFSRAEWATPDGLRQMDRVAAIMRAARDRFGIGLYWMTDAQLLAAHRGQIVGGWATHDQCRRVLGGTTHSDPMPAYPLDLLMAKATGANPGEDYDEVAVEEKLDRVLAWLDWWGTPDDDPATPEDERQPNSHGELAKRIRATHGISAATAGQVVQVLGIVRQGADVDEAALARELAPLLAPAVAALILPDLQVGTELSPEQLQAAVERGVAAVLTHGTGA